MTQCRPLPCVPARPSQRGLGLIELLVALALGSVVLLGCLRLALLARAHRGDQAQQQRLHERARHALSALEADLQMAGFYGLVAGAGVSTAGLPTTGADACGAVLPRDLGQAVTVLRGPWSLPCPPSGGGLAPGSDVLVLRRASGATAIPEPGRLQVYTSLARPADSRLVTDASAQGQTTSGAPATTELRDLVIRIYYLARRADGTTGASTPATTALRVKNLTRIAGQPAFIDTEVLPGVAQFSVEPLGTVTAGQPPGLLLRLGLTPQGGDGAVTTPALGLQHPVAFRNRPED
ncbi:MAG: hypothetical protein RL026_2265 [Pseudomonadota bacterium]|jgi:type IV pilus assembly protein PilW